MIIEDDIRFEKAFVRRLKHVMDDVDRIDLDWDLMWVCNNS